MNVGRTVDRALDPGGGRVIVMVAAKRKTTLSPGRRTDKQAHPRGSWNQSGLTRKVLPRSAQYAVAVRPGKSSVRNGVSGRPFAENILQTGLSAQA